MEWCENKKDAFDVITTLRGTNLEKVSKNLKDDFEQL